MKARTAHVQIRVTPEQKAMLKRLAASSGQDVSAYVLSRALPSKQVEFEQIVRMLSKEEEQQFALAELNEFLTALAPMEFENAVAVADLSSLSIFQRNYAAALVEQAAQLKKVSPPSWTAAIPPLDLPYFASPLRALRLHLLQASPAAFKKRNLFVDSGNGARV
jgi:uncharacterized protein (DUF1778 family)